ncbi:copper amine oxidase N-terminal domain-containing protein [Calorimonas adulescens]|uniref:Copper amine oxidase N-terminal domain-containing protein n=1 Tax=Calorimonas adulescens TaxID=2606906 RepID=A0A5D8Q9R6_9THEO|nr:copper amine oxidase N-terminal domain-containing protein [Calorimonas adulescens]TZE80253.1 copper amine oxidase N-terminal domain-containing protein [Calorimonas adulescens]
MKKLITFALAGLLIFSLTSSGFAKPNANGNKAQIKTERELTSQESNKKQIPFGIQKKSENNEKFNKFTAKMTVKGKELKFDVPPVIKDGRMLIPVRAIMEALGATVKWDPSTSTVTIIKGDTTIQFVLGESKALVNGNEVNLDIPAMEINNRTLVPLRFIAETLGEKVNYDNNTGDVNIEDNDTQNDTVSQDVYGNTDETVTDSVYSDDTVTQQ